MNETNELLKSLNNSVFNIATSLSDRTSLYVSLASAVISIMGIGVAAFAAWQAKKAAQEIALGRISEVQPVLKHYTFQYDPVDKKIIVNIQCKGRGSMYNLWLVKPERKYIAPIVEPNTSIGDFRISPVKKGKIVFYYEDLFGNKYKSSAQIANNTFDGNYIQEKLNKEN